MDILGLKNIPKSFQTNKNDKLDLCEYVVIIEVNESITQFYGARRHGRQYPKSKDFI